MNILFLSIGELGDLNENAVYPDMLRYFRDIGHEVYVVCQRERRSGLSTEIRMEHGIKVLRVKTGNITKTHLIEKGISTLLIGHQFRKAIEKFFRGVKFDLLLYSTPPITISKTVSFLKRRDSSFSYLMLKDIFPQNALDIGILKEAGWKGMLTKYFSIKEKELYSQSDYIGCMSEANIEFLMKNNPYLPKDKIGICPNTINPLPIRKIDKKLLREKLKLPQDKVIFIYGGNFGKPQDVDYIIKVLRKNAGKNDCHFVMCGSGTDFYKIKNFVKNNELQHITVIDSLNMQAYSQLLDACDIGLIFLDHRFTIPNFPSRLLDYMNHSLPVLAATDKNTDVGETIVNGGFGWWCESNNVQIYQKIVDEIISDLQTIQKKGKAGREYLEKHYDTKVACTKIINIYKNNTFK